MIEKTRSSEIAILAAGCFWGVEELLRGIPGVLSTEVGYCGGDPERHTYGEVKTGTTGHAEAIKMKFDPMVLSFAELLRLFFRMHDPTTQNRQGNDIGTQYRSAIFFQDLQQKQVAEEVLQEVTESGFWKRPIVTQITSASPFFSAESDHQNYLQRNPAGYTCHYWR
jgi:methionine-S-sulfoxide reductase